jgi:hypothetical protein
VVIKERVETFAVQNGDRYSVYDADGLLLNSKATQNVNAIDGSPNVLFTGDLPEATTMAAISNKFNQSFSAFRSLISSVEIVTSNNKDSTTLTFQFYSGLTAVILDWQTDWSDKIELVAQRYQSLSDVQKLSGSIRCQQVNGTGTGYQAVYLG